MNIKYKEQSFKLNVSNKFKRVKINDASRYSSDNGEPESKKYRVDLNDDHESLFKVADEIDVEPLDERNVKKMLSSFEKRVVKNQEMRVKFSGFYIFYNI